MECNGHRLQFGCQLPPFKYVIYIIYKYIKIDKVCCGCVVIGCPDVAPPPDAWLIRNGDSMVVSCNFTLKRWHIVCNGRDWIGSFTNCTSASPPQSRGQMMYIKGQLTPDCN